MKIEEEISRELQKGTPLAEVRRRFRSASQIYEAVRKYLPEVEKNLNMMQQTLREVGKKLVDTNGEFQRVCGEKNRVSLETAQLQKTREGLTAEVKDGTEKLNRLVAEVKGLEARGYSSTVIKKLMAIEAEGPELLSQVATAKQCGQLKVEVSSLGKRKIDLEGEVKALGTEKKSIEQLTVSEKNVLDELRLQTATFKKAMVAVESLLKAGYSTEDVKSLEHGLAVLGIKGDPVASISRLVGGLTKQKSILAVEEKLRRKELERDEVNRGLDAAKSKLAGIEQATLKTIQEGEKASVQAVASIRDSSTQAIAETGKRAEKAVEKVADRFEARTNESMGKFDVRIQQDADRYKVELEQTVKLERRRAEAETVLGAALPLAGLMKSLEDVKKVPPLCVLQVLERIQAWFEMNLPGASIKPPEYIHAKEHSFLTIDSYKLAVLVELAKEGLKQRMNGQQKT